MADFEPIGDLDYRRGGDTLSDLGEKYDTEIPWIFECINSIRRNKTGGSVGVVPDQIVIQDNKLYVVNSNGGLTLLGNISFGLGIVEEGRTVLTDDDVSTVAADGTGQAGKIVTLNADGLIPFGTTQGAAKLAGKRIDISTVEDGQVLVYREATNTFVGEQKGTVGAGKVLTISVDGEPIATYDGSAVTTIDLPLNLLGRNKAYNVGDRVRTAAIPSYYELECVTAGTTAATEPEWGAL